MVAIHHEQITHELTRKNRLHFTAVAPVGWRIAIRQHLLPAEWRYHLADECSVWCCPKPNTFLDSFTFNDGTIKINLFAQPRVRPISPCSPCSTLDIFFSFFFSIVYRARLPISHSKYFTSTSTEKARDLPKPRIWVNFKKNWIPLHESIYIFLSASAVARSLWWRNEIASWLSPILRRPAVPPNSHRLIRIRIVQFHTRPATRSHRTNFNYVRE